MRGQDLTKGKISKQIWSLAWPIMLSFFFQTLYNFVDAFWVGHLSENAIPAVSISQITLFIMISLGLGITVGSGVLMSMNIGRKDKPEAERILGQAFVLAAIIAGFFTILAILFKNEFLTASGAAGDIYPFALKYYSIISSGSILIFLQIVVVFAFNSQGDNKTVTTLFAISSIINAILDPILIFGWFGFPALGIQGAAIATLFSQAVMLVVGIRILSSPKMMIQFHWKNLVIKFQSVKKVLNIGFPAAITQVLNPILFAVLTQIIVNRFMEAGSVGFSVGFRIENFAFLPGIGFGTAAMAMIGQNVGARNLDRARKSHSKTQLYAFFAGSTIGLIAIILSSPIISLLSIGDPLSMEYARTYLISVPFTYGVLAMVFVNISTLQGTGKSWPGFFIYLIQAVIIASGSLILVNTMQGPIWSIWIMMILGRIITLGVSQWAVRTRFKSLKIEFEKTPEQSTMHHQVFKPSSQNNEEVREPVGAATGE